MQTGESERFRRKSERSGRNDRARNREAVIDALLDLVAEGNLAQSADEIAARAGVSRRSVFRYFRDLAELQRAAIQRQLERVSGLLNLDVDPELPPAARVRAFVERRLRLYEAAGAAMRLTRMRAPLHPVLAEQLRTARAHFAAQTERAFAPELAQLPERERRRTAAAVDALASFESCEVLQSGHGLAAEELAPTLTRAIARLLGVDTVSVNS